MLRRAVGNLQFRSLDSLLLPARVEQEGQGARGQKRPLHRIKRFAGHEHFLDAMYQSIEVREWPPIVERTEVDGERLWAALLFCGEQKSPDMSIQHVARCPESIA